MKRNLLILTLLLYGCSGGQKGDIYYEKYKTLSCDELKHEYLEILYDKARAFNNRMQGNNVNLALNTISGILTGRGQTTFDEKSYSEQEVEQRLHAIRILLRNNNCNATGAIK